MPVRHPLPSVEQSPPTWSTQRICFCCSVTKSRPTLCNPMKLQHTRLPCPLLSPGVCSDSRPLNQWCYLAISSSATPFSFVFSLSQHQGLFQWVSSLHQVPKYWSFSFTISPSKNIQDWFPLGLTGWTSLQSKGLSRVFSNTTVKNHQFLGTQVSL